MIKDGVICVKIPYEIIQNIKTASKVTVKIGLGPGLREDAIKGGW